MTARSSRSEILTCAREAYGHENYERAITLASSLIDVEPEDGEALIVRAEARMALGDVSGAREDSFIALTSKPESEEWLLVAAEAALRAGFPAEAVKILEPSWRESPSERRIAFKLGLAAERAGNHFLAVRALESAVSIKDAPARYWFYFARALQSMGNHSSAMAALSVYARRTEAAGLPFLTVDGGLLNYGQYIAAEIAENPAYAYGVYRSCLLAQVLGVAEISVIEFGVAGGRGLLALEKHAVEATRETGVKVRVTGFDTGVGLPAPMDFRDVPHFFLQGDYQMNEPELRERLVSAELIIGDAPAKFAEFLSGNGPTIGALFFDMDLYSSTANVLKSVGAKASPSRFLPRIAAYFDDVVPKGSNDFLKDYSEFTGERRAIAEFNSKNKMVKISKDFFFNTVHVRRLWHDCMYLIHRYDDPQYTRPVLAPRPEARQLPRTV